MKPEDIRIEWTLLPARTINVLKRHHIETIGHLLNFTEQELLWFYGIGKTSVEKIKAMLEEYGLKLRVGVSWLPIKQYTISIVDKLDAILRSGYKPSKEKI